MPKDNSIFGTIKGAFKFIIKGGSSKDHYELNDRTPLSDDLEVLGKGKERYIKRPVFHEPNHPSSFLYGNGEPVTPKKVIHFSKKSKDLYVKTEVRKLNPSEIRIITSSSPLSKRYENSPDSWVFNSGSYFHSPQAPNSPLSPEESNGAVSSFQNSRIKMGLFQPVPDSTDPVVVDGCSTQEKERPDYSQP